jgi:hypothetical protein
MRRALVVVGLAACGGEQAKPAVPTPPASATIVPIAASVSPPPSASVSAVPADDASPIDLGQPAVLALDGPVPAQYPELGLRFHADGVPFATVRIASGHFAFPAAASSAGVMAEVQVLPSKGHDGEPTPRLRGIVTDGDVVLYPQAPVVLAGCVIPWNTTPLVYLGATASGFHVGFSVEELELRDASAELAAGLAQPNEVGLSPGASWPVAWAPDDGGMPPAAVPRRAGTLALSATSDGPPVADLEVTTDTTLSILDTHGTRVRVVEGLPFAWAVGWVDASAIQRVGGTGLRGFGIGRGSGGFPPREPALLRRVRCASELPLFAEMNDERRAVGRVPAGTLVGVVEENGARVRVAFPNAQLHEGASQLFVTASALASCER